MPLTSQLRETKCIGQESVISSTSGSGNTSSGMETSKLSVFSPVLSSTIMQGCEQSITLPQSSYSNIHRPYPTSNYLQYSCNNAPYKAIKEEEDDIGDKKSAPTLSIIEKV